MDDQTTSPRIRGRVPGLTYRPIIRTQHDLQDAWRTLIGPHGFSGPSFWFMLIGADGVPFPHLTHVEDAHALPGPDETAALADMVGELVHELAPGGRVAFLRSRPGEVVHRACDHDVVPVPMDESLPAA